MISNVITNKTTYSYNDIKTSINELEKEIADRSFSLLKSNMYELKNSISQDYINNILFKYKLLKKELNKVCKIVEIYIPPTYTFEEDCE
jgi:hypothetical protein